MSKKESYPEEGEFVLATVENVFGHGAFVTLDEYENKRGLLHVSEMSLKWVKNIRDYVKENQKVVLRVLRVNPERGHIDLSLRRVGDEQRREKLRDVKRHQRANRLLEFLAGESSTGIDELDKKISAPIVKEYGVLYDGFEAIAINNKAADKLKIDKDLKEMLVKLINANIKPPFVMIDSRVELRSFAKDGIDVIKESLNQILSYEYEGDNKYDKSDVTIDVGYIAAPMYRIGVRAPNYKIAERVMKEASDRGIRYVEKYNGAGKFHRKLE
ncbi:MAG: hypothetical protein A7316_08220 [Candidatus Altiarchaeales archaeon WOR_SM1_86-2]|nr:MAG: hypothetical protein A7316_08220 [Candidatus Altiarchaeales archaeon WOR_SM1_86-2]